MTFLSDARQPEVDFFAPSNCCFEQTFGQIVSIRVKKLTNLVVLKQIEREKGSLSVDVRRSKTLLLKLKTFVKSTDEFLIFVRRNVTSL